MKITIPNILSVIRIILVAAFCIVYFRPGMLYLALIIILISGLSDLLDGYIARRFNQISELGKILDPIADKLFQFSTVVCFVISGAVPLWAVVIIFASELVMLIGSVVYYNKCDVVIAAKWYGKLASTLYFLSFLAVFAFQIKEKSLSLSSDSYLIISIIFAITILVSVFAKTNYIIIACKTYFEKLKDK